MTLDTVVVTVTCDVCQRTEHFELVRIQHAESLLDDTMREYGWWTREDFTDVCPNHPKPVDRA